jgi:hypothetical protein
MFDCWKYLSNIRDDRYPDSMYCVAKFGKGIGVGVGIEVKLECG